MFLQAHTEVLLGMKCESVNDDKSGQLEEFQYNRELGIWSKICFSTPQTYYYCLEFTFLLANPT